MGKHFVEMGKPNERSLPVPHASCLWASPPWVRGLCYWLRGMGLEEPFVAILAAHHWTCRCCRWSNLPNRWILSFLKEREGTWCTTVGKKGGYSRQMERQERRHVLCFLGHLEPSNIFLANLGKHKHSTLWEGKGTVADVEEVVCTEAMKMEAETRKSQSA